MSPAVVLDSIDRLPEALPPRVQSVLVVADGPACRAIGVFDRLAELVGDRECLLFDRFDPNPALADLEQALEEVGDRAIDAVVAVGGGTAIDLAKLVALALANADRSPREVVDADTSELADALPVIAAPTTAGTGSEATRFAVVYVDGKKRSIEHDSLLPTPIVDPRLTHSLPPRQTAATGLDAFCQAIEASWGIGSNEESDGYAERAVALAWEHLSDAVQQPTPDVRAAMCEASHLAGRAINITRTTAPHALSYHLTGRYDVPHGMAVAFSLPTLLRYNAEVTDADCNDPRGAAESRRRVERIVRFLGADDAAQAVDRLTGWIAELGAPTKAAEVGLDSNAAIDAWLADFNPQRAKNNPRRVDPAALRAYFVAVR